MMTHDLKTWPGPFAAIWLGNKTAEFRKDDRDFQWNDQLRLNEWIPDAREYTGRVVVATITWIGRGPDYGIPEGYAMLCFRETVNWGPLPDRTLLKDLLGV